MILAAAKKTETNEFIATLREICSEEKHFSRWMEHPSSSIVHHDDECCASARLWFLAYARSMEIWSLSRFKLKAPTWLSERFEWGPSEWPISWCQLVKQKTIDCGVFAALAREIFKAQGHSVYPAQGLLIYNHQCTAHWRDLWKPAEEKAGKRGEVFPWVGNRIVYHEFCVIEGPEGEARFYDSTFGGWYEPHQRLGFGALLAVKSECPRVLHWGDKIIYCDEWINL